MKFFVETFGCQMNAADSQEMGRHLLARGFSPTDRAAEADCILVNTCTVRQHAEDKALSYLGRLADWRKADKRRLLVVAGCAAERLGEKLKSRFPQVDLVVGAKSIDRFQDLLEKEFPHLAFDAAREERDAWNGDMRIDALLPHEKTSAFVTIMRGCNFNCSYCIVPAVRGREIYRPAKSILSEVRQKAALGVKEIMLLGQTVNSYRPDLPNPGAGGVDVADFGDLLRAVNAVPGIHRIRFMSPHPHYLNQKFAADMAESKKVCRHMHLPVQSGSDAMLKRMRRNYTRAEYLQRTAMLRRAMPDISITTDFIVGFPGETEEDFKLTLSLAVEAGLDGAFIFKYSPRPGTASADQADDVSQEEKESRHARLSEVTESLSSDKVPSYIGTRAEVLVESIEDGQGVGRLEKSRKVFFPAAPGTAPGDLVMVDITGATRRSLSGRPA